MFVSDIVISGFKDPKLKKSTILSDTAITKTKKEYIIFQ